MLKKWRFEIKLVQIGGKNQSWDLPDLFVSLTARVVDLTHPPKQLPENQRATRDFRYENK